jgi:hypothetical protein
MGDEYEKIEAFLEPEHIIALPPAAQAFFIALTDGYVRSGGEIEVFSGRLLDGSSSMRVRPANVYGHMEFLFDPSGRIKDVLWDSAIGAPPREGDSKSRGPKT